MKRNEALNLVNQIMELLDSSRSKLGILTTDNIPHELKQKLTAREQYKVLQWMRVRQCRGRIKRFSKVKK